MTGPIRSMLATTFALALSLGVSACDPGSDEPRLDRTSGSEKPDYDEDGIIDDEEGLVDDQTFGDEGLIEDDAL